MLDLQGTNLKTWYYNPSQIKKWSGNRFKLITTVPIGFVLPPSYLEVYFSTRKRFLLRLNILEKRFDHVPFLSGMADHFLIDLKLK